MSMPLRLPRLEDTRVVLRAFSDDDVPLIQDTAADPIIPLITSVPTTSEPEEAQAFIDRQHARLTSGEGYSFAIADSATDEAVGQIGCGYVTCAKGEPASATGSPAVTVVAGSPGMRCASSHSGGSPSATFTASSCTSNPGTGDRGAPLNESDTNAKDYFAAGNP